MAALFALIWLPGQDLPQYGPMPAFALTDQDGQIVESSTLRGKSLLVSFIFTNCTDICPMVTAQMSHLEDHLRQTEQLNNDLLLLSLTVDPERDTPDVLKTYAASYGADLAHWRFLTGEPDAMRRVVVDGFMTGMERMEHHPGHDHTHAKGEADVPGYDVSHSGRIALVDPSGQIRAYYDSQTVTKEQVAADLRQIR
jgi:protein SCO1/2